MATSRIVLPVEIAELPAANPAVLSAVQSSSAVATTNTPKPTWKRLEFDQTTDQTAIWNLRLPSDWLSGLTVTLKWAAAVNAGNVVWKGGVAPCIDGTTSQIAGTFVAGDLSATVAVPATIGLTKETGWALTTTGLTAGQFISVFVGRDADNGSDTAAGLAYGLAVELSYTS